VIESRLATRIAGAGVSAMLAGAAVFMTPTSSTAAMASGSPARASADRAVAGAGHSPGGRSGAQVPGGTRLWRRAYSLGFGGGAVAVVASPDSSTVFVTGSVTGPHGHSQIGTVAYRAATGAQLWVARYRGPVNTDSNATSLAVSPDGQRVFVTGRYVGRHISSHGVTLAYQAATGASPWTAVNPSARPIFPHGAAISPDGSTLFVTSGDGVGLATIAYHAATGGTVWTQEYTGPQPGGSASAVAVSPDGATVFVTGSVQVSPGDDEYATVAYQAATGTMRWASVQNGTSGSFGDDSGASALALSPDGGTVFVTGTLTTTRGASYGTAAYNAATGTKLWLRLYQSQSTTTLNDFAAALAVSPDGGAVFVTGAANNAYGTVAYAAGTGAQQWVALYHPGISFASSVAVSPDGTEVFVTGTSAEASQSSQYATITYAPATGAKIWLRRYPGPSFPSALGQARSVTASPDGSTVFVTGLVQNPLSQPSEYTTIAYQP
jgi:DNA-binding beta-propeller fold protein YncE